MSNNYLGIALAVLVSLSGIGADSFLKIASMHAQPLANRWFAAGMLLTLLFALGWLVLMRYMKLATAGAFYAVASALLLTVIGVVFFDEQLSVREITGLGLAVCSVSLLARFAA
jgi:multidrug transporter EmrE-like cation transporter